MIVEFNKEAKHSKKNAQQGKSFLNTKTSMPVISRNIPHQFSGSSSDFDITERLAFPKDLFYNLAYSNLHICIHVVFQWQC